MDNTKSLSEHGIKGDELIYLGPSPSTAIEKLSDGEKIERVRQAILNNHETRSKLIQVQPELVEAAQANPTQFATILRSLKDARQEIRERASPSSTIPPEFSPFNEESQRRIRQLLQEQRINENLAHAMEYHPEAFGSVTMLYIPCKVNNSPLKAFVDCGAQTTIMMASCAQRCGLSELIDRRFTGIAKGVGTGRIEGRVHLVQLQLGGQFLPCSMTIIDGDGPDMLLGLDMLKRHQCCIDLRDGVLSVNGEQISFLPEAEIPKEKLSEGEEILKNQV